MNYFFGRNNNADDNISQNKIETVKDSIISDHLEERRRSMSSETDSIVLDDNKHSYIHDITQRKGSICRIILGPDTGLFGTHIPETHQSKKVTLDDFMTQYNKYQINGTGFKKEDYLKKK
ncbi:Hypothetical protein SRAE_0000000900 [Strongyloides ratti]|uniref:Uncharacterized protein n=1 Tax=Strongyloides ratti TaxID=34506 RepID=A0A090KYC2_STRRB|nr:Hypothetical protein SRAE_0000000900 [Strongyloides ratti]CEF60877.1 Hypothetical protein SRAE_0000000900 [Strongyloides ratti]